MIPFRAPSGEHSACECPSGQFAVSNRAPSGEHSVAARAPSGEPSAPKRRQLNLQVELGESRPRVAESLLVGPLQGRTLLAKPLQRNPLPWTASPQGRVLLLQCPFRGIAFACAFLQEGTWFCPPTRTTQGKAITFAVNCEITQATDAGVGTQQSGGLT